MAVFGFSVKLRLAFSVVFLVHALHGLQSSKKAWHFRAIVDADTQHNHCVSSLTHGEVY